MQLKITVNYYLIPVKMAIIRKQKITSVGQDVEKWNSHTLLMECNMVQLL